MRAPMARLTRTSLCYLEERGFLHTKPTILSNLRAYWYQRGKAVDLNSSLEHLISQSWKASEPLNCIQVAVAGCSDHC